MQTTDRGEGGRGKNKDDRKNQDEWKNKKNEKGKKKIKDGRKQRHLPLRILKIATPNRYFKNKY